MSPERKTTRLLQKNYHKLSFLHLAVFEVVGIVPNCDLQSEGQGWPRDGLKRLSSRDEARDRVDGEK